MYWYWRVNRELVSRLPAALACGLIRRGCSPANLVKRAPCYGRAAGVARSRRRQASTAGKASGPGDQARPRGLKPRGAAAAAARCVPSRGQRSSRAAGDRSLSGAGDQAGGCSGLQRGEPRGGTGWYLHLGPVLASCSVYPSRFVSHLGSGSQPCRQRGWCVACAYQAQKAHWAHPLASRHSSNHH